MLSQTQISVLARNILKAHGYTACPLPEEWEGREGVDLFEDEYSIVGVVVYPSCSELLDQWTADQGRLTEVISKHIGQGEAKAAEGYLVLLTGGDVPAGRERAITRIRYDTSRVRKLVATGEDLEMKKDVERELRPLLPLEQEESEEEMTSGLEELRGLLDMPAAATERLVEAYRGQKSLLNSLKRHLEDQ